MRSYIISYYVEHNDECQERQIKLEATNLYVALSKFKEKNIVCKRIYKIEEKVN